MDRQPPVKTVPSRRTTYAGGNYCPIGSTTERNAFTDFVIVFQGEFPDVQESYPLIQ